MSSSAPQAAPAALPVRRLEALRSELDRVDDALHDLLMRRAELVTQVGALGAKGRVPLRPGREASIIRRLVARNRGALDRSTLVRLWRELLAGSSAQQQPMTVVVGDASLLVTARAHFGVLTGLDVAADALGLVSGGAATLAVMPWPAPWWPRLLDDPAPPHIVARLPFWVDGTAGPGCVIVSSAAPDPSGDDRTLIAARDPAFADRFDDAALTRGDGVVLADVAGFVTPDDPRLPPEARVLGAYAVPIGDTV